MSTISLALVASFVLSACVPLLSPSTSGRTYGQGPIDAVWAAADAHAKCSGLTSAELAAMMMVPTYPETGGPVPSPMTLGRWDNVNVWSLNSNLFAFGQTSGPYVGAFFTAGVGMWQFDSAGGWNLTAADAIDSVKAAQQAATTIAFRYCNPPSSVADQDAARRAYAWGPWYGCSSWSGWDCEALYQDLYESEMLDVSVDDRVGRYGGMEQRTCDISGLGTALTCWYVDPARAQGSTGWRYGSYDPAKPGGVTPLPEPFYVVSHNGREYRYWLPVDTGYDTGITAHKSITGNARTSLTWVRSAPLCDRTLGRGSCGNSVPFGSFDAARSPGPNQVRVQGWAIDRDTQSGIPVHVYIGSSGHAITANKPRADVAGAYPGTGDRRGFDAVLPAPVGTHDVCAYAIDVGGSSNVLLGCRSVTVLGPPRGSLDVVTGRPGSLRAAGWMSVEGDLSAQAVIRVNGVERARFTPSLTRSDVQASVPGAGATAGFSVQIPSEGGTHRVCLSSVGAPPEALGCRTVTLPTGPPFGSLDVVRPVSGGVEVAGWAIDPDTSAAIDVHVYAGSTGVAVRADRTRGDVGAAFPLYGSQHGYSARIETGAGPTTVCAYAINVGGGSNVSLGCRTVTVVGGSPFGSLDVVRRTASGIAVAGWAIDPDTTGAADVHVYVGGAGYALRADRPRPDVGAAFPGYGDAHGYAGTLPAPGSAVPVCVYAINVAGGGGNVLLGCRTV
ncbi:hypothetical protein [Rhabdothermincola salaria]|uniref:hypothetical protein n=1 Tax=Rhabdothermincola salaria TaxID=2903142 RepID=UPI001E433130|nr:hypothetical protein [Rhabdothermincola salaria]MCD9623391.1 hypothetical protein [Rhabdothermincola salaria]